MGVGVTVGVKVGVTVGVSVGVGVGVTVGVKVGTARKRTGTGVAVGAAVGTAADRPRAAQPPATSRQSSSSPAKHQTRCIQGETGKLAFTTASAGQERGGQLRIVAQGRSAGVGAVAA